MNKQPQTDSPEEFKILFISVFLLLIQFIIVSSLQETKHTILDRNQEQIIYKASIDTNQNLSIKQLQEFFESYKNGLAKLSHEESDYQIDDHIDQFFAKDATVEVNIKDVNVPANNLIFEGYFFAIDEYPWAYKKYNLTTPNIEHSSPIFNIVTPYLARIAYSYHSTEQINRKMYDFLHEPLTLVYHGACTLEINKDENGFILIKSSTCNLSISGKLFE